VDEKDEISIKEAAEAVVRSMDFKGEVIVIIHSSFHICSVLIIVNLNLNF
jgi:hypothetical protein